jgi:hypothetical protein
VAVTLFDPARGEQRVFTTEEETNWREIELPAGAAVLGLGPAGQIVVRRGKVIERQGPNRQWAALTEARDTDFVSVAGGYLLIADAQAVRMLPLGGG